MAKYLVETYYNCTFKVSHYLDEISDSELKNLEKRDDGKFEIIDVKLDNRKTKNLDKIGKVSEINGNGDSKLDLESKIKSNPMVSNFAPKNNITDNNIFTYIRYLQHTPLFVYDLVCPAHCLTYPLESQQHGKEVALGPT